MDRETHDLIFYFTMVAILVPILLLLPGINRRPVEYKWLAALLIFSFLCDFVNEVQWRYRAFPVNIINNIYVILNPIFLGFFFYHCLRWRRLKRPLIVFNLLYLTLAILNFIFIQKTGFNTYSNILEKLMTMVLCILYFSKVIRELSTENIYRHGMFWIVSTMFVINSVKLVLTSFAYYLIIFKDNLVILWSIHNIMSIVGSLSIGFGMWTYRRNHHYLEAPISS